MPGCRRFSLIPILLLLASAGTTRAQVVVVPSTPQVGSSNPATAEPTVPRPTTKPCVVQLFQNLEFDNYTPQTYSYTPPASCPGPWAKVVFTADFTVTAGTQFDRSGAFYLGHANIYYGTTAEPRSALSPSWHVERDVTDLSAIFKSPQTGEANLGNFVGVYDGTNYNGIIYANAALEFYPADFRNPAPRVPDMVIPVNGTGGDAGTLNTGSDQITQTLNLPENVESVYLDVITQNQIGDEFWYFCVPTNETGPLESCGNTAFREGEVSIDGNAAGVAPVYPWIFTGGIDPFLWEPITGVQTLDFVPYRVNLTPYAGVLGDGNTHTVAVSVFNANGYFLATANLLVYLDHGTQKTTGGLISNTLAAPNPQIQNNITTDASGNSTGNILTTSNRNFTISGWLNTSHGRVVTTVKQSVDFSNNQEFVVNATTDEQNVQQLTSVHSTTTTQQGWQTTSSEENFEYPLNIDFLYAVNADGSSAQTTTVHQADEKNVGTGFGRFPLYNSNLSNQVDSTDTLNFSAAGAFTGNTDSQTTGTYTWRDSRGECYSRTIASKAQVLTSVKTGPGCFAHNPF
ncbi:MAG TPA: peptide-N4-asparagine amidase [Acidobacteriaceae bacterium]|nr:peptide-N4-asparagine amidase [Acidobacteriaceae bacterium]